MFNALERGNDAGFVGFQGYWHKSDAVWSTHGTLPKSMNASPPSRRASETRGQVRYVFCEYMKCLDIVGIALGGKDFAYTDLNGQITLTELTNIV